jgi:hypothetical protein
LASDGKGPVRLAHFTVVSGDACWRTDATAPWSAATGNLPIREGAELSTVGSAKAEIAFDDGSRMRLGKGAYVTLKALYSDSQGEFTQLVLRGGTLDLRLQHECSVYEIDAPLVTIDATGPSTLRIDAENGVCVAVREGRCTIDGDRGKKTLAAGQYLVLRRACLGYGRPRCGRGPLLA